jgi:hypothetical protein
MFAEYRSDRRYTKLDPKSKRNHAVGFKPVGGYVLTGDKEKQLQPAPSGPTGIVSIDAQFSTRYFSTLNAPRLMLLSRQHCRNCD